MSVDDELFEQFESAQVPRQLWTHRTHVRVAFLCLRRFGFEEALVRMRHGIVKLNAANGVEESLTMGYNETTTTAFMHLIASTMEAYGRAIRSETSEEFCDAHPHLMAPSILRLFYSPERRLDPRGKVEFLEPDLASLPKNSNGWLRIPKG